MVPLAPAAAWLFFIRLVCCVRGRCGLILFEITERSRVGRRLSLRGLAFAYGQEESDGHNTYDGGRDGRKRKHGIAIRSYGKAAAKPPAIVRLSAPTEMPTRRVAGLSGAVTESCRLVFHRRFSARRWQTVQKRGWAWAAGSRRAATGRLMPATIGGGG